MDMAQTQPAEFSLESVRQLMLANGGRVTNHDLVKSFRRWLTDPNSKELARAQFKDYVNTLASIKQEGGEKYLILKKKFYPEYYNNCGYVDAVTPVGYHQGGTSYDSGYSTNGGYSTSDQSTTGYISTDPYSYNGQKQPNSGYNNSSSSYGQQHSSDKPSSGDNNGSSYSQQHSIERPRSGYVNSSNYGQQQSTEISSSGYNNSSPSFLDEVMAGFSPPSKTMGRKLPAIPNQQPSPNNVGLPNSGPNSLGLPAVKKDTHQGHTYQSPVQSSQYQSPVQSSQYQSPVQTPLYQSQLGRPLQQPPNQPYAQPTVPTYQPVYNSPSAYNRQTSKDNLQGSTSDLAYNQGYNPHIPQQLPDHPPSQRHSMASSFGSSNSSLAQSTYSSQHYTSGSPRGSHAPPYKSGSPKTTPPYPQTGARPPPPYRPPPPDPPTHTQARQLPERPKDRPSELNISSAYRSADPVLPSHQSQDSLISPPPPPKRTVPSETQPPPLPRRPLPPTPRSVTNQSTTAPSESSQPSPTDSGFTEDLNKFSNSPTPKSLSKSYGNLLTGEDKENDVPSRLESSVSLDQLDTLPANKESEHAISVKERTKTFNRMASETEIPSISTSTTSLSKLPSAVKRRNSRAIEFGTRRGSSNRLTGELDENDSASITTIDPTIKKWMVATAKGDYQTAARMLSDEPKLSRHKDFTTGYTALHWACKHGNTDLVKLLAGTYQSQVNTRSHGGYTPLHLAAQHNHQDVFDLLVQIYKADANLRDYAGKKPRQYMIASGDTGGLGLSMSSDTFRQLKDRGKNRTSRSEKGAPGILRFGSLSVKVKKTTEAFNNIFNSGETKESKPRWGSEMDNEKMPPPKFAPIKKRKSKRTIDFGRTKSAPVTPTERSPIKEVIPEEVDGEGVSDSDSEYGFGDKWGPGDKPGTTSEA